MFVLVGDGLDPNRKFKPTYPPSTYERRVYRGARLGSDRLAADQ